MMGRSYISEDENPGLEIKSQVAETALIRPGVSVSVSLGELLSLYVLRHQACSSTYMA